MAIDKFIYIPCKTYIRKYFEATCGYPFRVTDHSLMGIYFKALIEKKFYDSRHHKFNDSFTNRHFNDKLTFVVSNFVFFKIGYDVSLERILAINRLLEQQFEEHLFMYCDAYVSQGKERKEAIHDFAKKFKIEIEFDVTYDGLKKTEYRLRKKRELVLESAINAPKLF